MNKNLIYESAKTKFEGELLDVVIKQINDYIELKESNYIIKNEYQINDKVFLRGSRKANKKTF